MSPVSSEALQPGSRIRARPAFCVNHHAVYRVNIFRHTAHPRFTKPQFHNNISLAATRRASKTTEKSTEYSASRQLHSVYFISPAGDHERCFRSCSAQSSKATRTSDYFSANFLIDWNYRIKTQYCWAHRIRDIRFLLKHPDKRITA